MSRLIICLPVICLSLFACSNHQLVENNNNPPGYADSQVVGVWKITGYSSSEPYDWNGDGRPESNIFSNWSSCEKDNLYQFIADKTGIFKISCSVTSPGAWQIINTHYLRLTPTGQNPDAEKIISMTSSEFITAKEVTVSTGQNLTLTKTWTRQ